MANNILESKDSSQMSCWKFKIFGYEDCSMNNYNTHHDEQNMDFISKDQNSQLLRQKDYKEVRTLYAL